jgi:DNA repair protein RecO (recombination protein O)
VTRYYKTEAVVIRTHDLREADRIVTLVSPSEGKVGAVARGVRRPRSKLAASVQPFTRAGYMLVRGRNLDTIAQAEVLTSFRALREDLDRMAAASYVAELAGEVARERDPAPELYQLLVATLTAMATAGPERLDLLVRRSELGVLDAAGYRPELEACVNCGRAGGPLAFSAAAGGVVCPGCAGTGTVMELGADTLAAMRALRRLPPGRVDVLRVNPRTARELRLALEACIVYRLERRPRSLDALNELSKLRNGV